MKIRIGYVSNSSSASFVVHNFSGLPTFLQDAIINYDEAAYWWCRRHEVELETYEFEGYDDDPNDPNSCGGKVWVDRRPDGFGWINDRCRYRAERDSMTDDGADTDLTLTACMNNFDMGNWLKVLGVEYECLYED